MLEEVSLPVEKPVAIVVGALPHADLLRPFVEAYGASRVVVFAHESHRQLLSAYAGVKICYMAKVEDLPGYMERLEQHLEPFSVILTTDLYSIATFQVLNYTEKNGKRFSAINSSTHFRFLEGARNLQVILAEVLRKAEYIFSFTPIDVSEESSESGMSHRLIPVPTSLSFRDQAIVQKRRQKFRNMLKLDDNDRVILLLAGDDLPLPDLRGLFRAIIELNRGTQNDNQHPTNYRLLICDPARRHDILKYQAHESGLGQSALFLNQDPSHFWPDLLSSANFYLVPAAGYCEIDQYPFLAVDALQYGLVLLQQGIVLPGLENFGIQGDWRETADWVQALQQLAQFSAEKLATCLLKASEKGSEDFRNILRSLLDAVPASLSSVSRKQLEMVEDIENLTRLGQVTEAMLDVMQHFLSDALVDDALKKRIFWARGMAMEKLGDYIAAIGDYESCLLIDSQFVEGLRGLGTLAAKTFSFDEALVFFKKLISLQPQDASAALAIGHIYARLGLLAEAVSYLERACQDSYERGKALASLVHLLNNSKASALVEQTYLRLMDMYGSDKNLLMGYSRYLNENGFSQESRAILLQLQSGA